MRSYKKQINTANGNQIENFILESSNKQKLAWQITTNSIYITTKLIYFELIQYVFYYCTCWYINCSHNKFSSISSVFIFMLMMVTFLLMELVQKMHRQLFACLSQIAKKKGKSSWYVTLSMRIYTDSHRNLIHNHNVLK